MKTVHRFQIRPIDDVQHLPVPIGSKPLHVAVRQRDHIDMWFEVDTDEPPSPPNHMAVQVIGTGHPLPTHRLRHVASVVDEPFVWHVYAVLA